MGAALSAMIARACECTVPITRSALMFSSAVYSALRSISIPQFAANFLNLALTIALSLSVVYLGGEMFHVSPLSRNSASCTTDLACTR